MPPVAIEKNNGQPKEGNTELGSKHRWREFHQRSRRGLTFNLRLSLRFSVAGLKMRRLMVDSSLSSVVSGPVSMAGGSLA